MEAVDVLGEAINSCQTKELCLVPIYYIGKVIESAHKRRDTDYDGYNDYNGITTERGWDEYLSGKGVVQEWLKL